MRLHESEVEEIEDFFEHGAEKLPDFDVILCTEKGRIVFLDQPKNLCCKMKYGGLYSGGITLMQYCTDHSNKWTEKVMWISDLYLSTLVYTEVEP